MGLTLKTTQELYFSETNTADATNKVLIAANTELSIVSCTVVGDALQLTLSTPINGLSQGFIQASGVVSVLAPTAPMPSKIGSVSDRSSRTEGGGKPTNGQNHPNPPNPPNSPKS